MVLVSIDPGITGLGFAVWSGGELTNAGVLTPRKEDDWLERAYRLANDLEAGIFCPLLNPAICVCEFQELRSDAVSLAAGHKQDLAKLTFVTGSIAYAARRSGVRFELVNPSEWKGSLPKAVVERRIRQILGEATIKRVNPKSHAWDAIGIGLWRLGRF